MAISTRAGLESLTDWLNIPGSDGTGLGGAIGSLAMLAKIWYDMTKDKTDRPPLPNVSTDKVLPKDYEKYGSKEWPEAGKMVQELLGNKNTNIGELINNYSKWLRKEMEWPEAGKQVETLPLGQTGRLDVPAPTMPNYGTEAWPNEGKMVETLPLGQTGNLDITTPATPPNYGTEAWPNEGKMVETLPLGQTGNLDVPRPIAPGTTVTPNYGTEAWPNEGKMVETLPLGQTGNLDVPRPIAPGTTVTPNYGTEAWPNEGKMVETLPLGDTGKLDVTKPIIDVKPNVDVNTGADVGTNEWVSGAINATEAWPNEGQMVESIPPYKKDEPNINWSGPMITDKTNENNEVAINPVSFDSLYDLIKAEQKERWAREDAIRWETQRREDNAWERAVADMFRSGVNPNLVNAGPAESGGGITQATGMNYTMWEAGLQKEIALLQQSIDQNFKGDENDKDRFTQILGNVLSMFSVIAMFKGKI